MEQAPNNQQVRGGLGWELSASLLDRHSKLKLTACSDSAGVPTLLGQPAWARSMKLDRDAEGFANWLHHTHQHSA
jgi:hypothetical protein